MRSIPLAITWEMLRRGRWTLLAAALGANALPALLFTALRHDGAIDPADQSQIIMHVMMVQINWFMFGTAVVSSLAPMSRLYAFPVPTSSLVAWHLLPAMTAVAVEVVISTALLNAAFDLRWPLWGPALFAAVGLAAIQSTLWLTEKSGWLAVAITLVTAGLGIWFASRYGRAFSAPKHYWSEVTPTDVMSLLAAAISAYGVGIVGVARNRCGQPPYSLGLIAWLQRAFATAPDLRRPFRTPAEAQLWFEWRQKGWAMPAVVVFGMIMGVGGWLIGSRDAKDLFQGFILGGGLLSLAGLVCGIIAGNFGGANSQVGHFLATRPITSTELARIVLKTVAKSLLIAWGIWALSFLALDLVLLALRVRFPLALPVEFGWWYFPATLVGAWTMAGLAAAVVLAGRRGFALTLFFGLYALSLGPMLLPPFVLSPQAQEQFAHSLLITCGVVFVLGTVWAFAAARRRSLVGVPTLFVAASMWGLLSALVVVEWVSHSAKPFSPYVLVAGILALSVSPLATAPLALAWNRNR
jgi:hypothetical protein